MADNLSIVSSDLLTDVSEKEVNALIEQMIEKSKNNMEEFSRNCTFANDWSVVAKVHIIVDARIIFENLPFHPFCDFSNDNFSVQGSKILNNIEIMQIIFH